MWSLKEVYSGGNTPCVYSEGGPHPHRVNNALKLGQDARYTRPVGRCLSILDCGWTCVFIENMCIGIPLERAA